MALTAAEALVGARALVLGASGFLGRWVCEALLAKGAVVAMAVRDPRRLRAALAARADAVFPVDLASTGAATAVIEQWRPAVVFQLAGYGVAKDERDPAAMQRLNTGLLADVVAGLQRPAPGWPGLRLVHAGSALEYGVQSQPLDEAGPTDPSTAYGRSKLDGTRIVQDAVRSHGLPALVARLFTVFGPGERPGRLLSTLLAASTHTAAVPLSSGEQQRDFGLVHDVAEALVELATMPGATVAGTSPVFDGAIVNVATGRLQAVRTFVLAAARALGIDESRLHFGAVPRLPEEMPHLPVPVARLHRALGRTLPADLDAAFARLQPWLAGERRG